MPRCATRSLATLVAAACLGIITSFGAAPAAAQAPPALPPLDPELETELLAIPDENARLSRLIDEEGWDLSPDLRDETLDLLLLEIAILERLDAFQTGPQPGREVARIEEAFAPWPPDSDVALRAALHEIDDELALVKFDVVDQLGDQGTPIYAALDEMSAGTRNRLAAGETAFISPGQYIPALAQVLSEGTAPRLTDVGLHGVEMGQPLDEALSYLTTNDVLDEFLVADAEDLGDRLDLLETPSVQENNTAWYAAAGAVAVVVLLLAVIVVLRRRAKRRVDVSHGVLDAHRQLTSATEEPTIASIAVGAAIDGADADGGVLLRTTGEGLRIAGSDTIVEHTALGRVVETGQAMLAVLPNEPACAGVPAAVAAVPIVANGRVEGVLVVWRAPDRPFDDDARHEIEKLAPPTGGALLSADKVGSYQTLAMVDGLTSLGNRRRLDGDLETTLADSGRHGGPVAFAMIDVDHFKNFNDTHGHAAGDAALRTVAQVIAACVRSGDVVYRYGGEEFSVLLPATTTAEALAVTERIRAEVERTEIEGEREQPGGRLTVSVGVATVGETDEVLDASEADIKKRADDALYRAKSEGRNRVAVD